MVESFDIYAILNGIGVIVLIVLCIFIFYRRSETWNEIVRLCLSIVLMLINLFKIPVEVQIDRPYETSMFLVILWFMVALLITVDLGIKLGKNSH